MEAGFGGFADAFQDEPSGGGCAGGRPVHTGSSGGSQGQSEKARSRKAGSVPLCPGEGRATSLIRPGGG